VEARHGAGVSGTQGALCENPDVSTLQVGDTAPDFTLQDQDGSEVSLSGLRGRKVVLYFYPRDDTPGCTTQACSLRDRWHDIVDTGAQVYGISADDAASHVKFREKYNLPFPLLADTEHAAAEAYGTWVEKTNYGKKYWGIERSTFLVGEDGTLERIWRRVKPDQHTELVLEALQG
jgi:peroxiredoxin Q/BCP